MAEADSSGRVNSKAAGHLLGERTAIRIYTLSGYSVIIRNVAKLDSNERFSYFPITIPKHSGLLGPDVIRYQVLFIFRR